MTATTTSYRQPAATGDRRRRQLRQVVGFGAALDTASGIFCLAAAGDIAGWLSISTGAVRATGAVFLVAAVAGVETLLKPALGTRWIVGANLAFAVWCVLAIAFDAPDVVGGSVLAAAGAGAVGIGATEHVLGTRR